MHYPVWTAGQTVTAERLIDQAENVIATTATLDRSSTTTLADDTVLTTTLAANATYLVEFSVVFSSTSTTPDVNTNWTVPSSATGRKFRRGPTSNNSTMTSSIDSRIKVDAVSLTTSGAYQVVGTTAATQTVGVTEVGIVVTSTTSGTLAFQWAQNTSNATATTRGADSYLKVCRIA